VQATCDAANADEERKKWLEVEVQRLKRKSEALEQQLTTSRTAALAMVARIEQLEVGGLGESQGSRIWGILCCCSAASVLHCSQARP
jgi:hypothetical protein